MFDELRSKLFDLYASEGVWLRGGKLDPLGEEYVSYDGVRRIIAEWEEAHPELASKGEADEHRTEKEADNARH